MKNKNLIKQFPEKAKTMKKRLQVWGQELKNPGIPSEPVRREKRWYAHYFKSVK